MGTKNKVKGKEISVQLHNTYDELILNRGAGGGCVASFNASKKIYPVILRIFAVWFTTPPVYSESSHWALRKTAGYFLFQSFLCVYISFYIRQNALNINASSLPSKTKRNRFTYHMHASSIISTWQKKKKPDHVDTALHKIRQII